VLELAKEQLLEIVQDEPAAARGGEATVAKRWPAPIYVKSLAASGGDAANDPASYDELLPEPSSDESGA
jgi:hypothetical protein